MLIQCEGAADELYLGAVLGLGGPGVDVNVQAAKKGADEWASVSIAPKAPAVGAQAPNGAKPEPTNGKKAKPPEGKRA
jgi:hypothetical protein